MKINTPTKNELTDQKIDLNYGSTSQFPFQGRNDRLINQKEKKKPKTRRLKALAKRRPSCCHYETKTV